MSKKHIISHQTWLIICTFCSYDFHYEMASFHDLFITRLLWIFKVSLYIQLRRSEFFLSKYGAVTQKNHFDLTTFEKYFVQNSSSCNGCFYPDFPSYANLSGSQINNGGCTTFWADCLCVMENTNWFTNLATFSNCIKSKSFQSPWLFRKNTLQGLKKKFFI